jgi:hypothetical protein
MQRTFLLDVLPRCNTVVEAYNRFYKDSLVELPKLSTLQEWALHYDQYGELPIETTKRERSVRKRAGPKIVCMSPVMLEYLRNLVREEPDLYLDEISECLQMKGWNVCRSSIWCVLTKRFGWTLRLFTSRARQKDAILRTQYRQAIMQVPFPEMLVFVDETHRGRNESRRRRAWAPRGEDNSLDAFFFGNDLGATLLAAADLNGFVLPMCELVFHKKGAEDADPTRGTIDTDRFMMWVQQRLCPFLGSAVMCEARSVVVMDNASIHQNPRIKEMIEATGASLIYSAPYSPDLNPIEFAFHQYKANLRRNFRRRNAQNTFEMLHLEALLSVTRSNMRNY